MVIFCTFFLVTMSVLFIWAQAVAQQSANALLGQELVAQRPVTARDVTDKVVSEIELPAFASAKVVEQFGGIALDIGMPLDEVSYVFEPVGGQPFHRYRINMSVKTGYAQVRRFVAALAVEMPNVSLDAIRCGRENVAAQLIACELAFSAFFERPHGG